MNKRLLHLEYFGKGLALALLSFLVFETLLVETTARWDYTGLVFGLAGLGLVAFLGQAAFRKVREGHRIRGRWTAFFLFLLLENPYSVYGGILGGMFIAMPYLIQEAGWSWWHLGAAMVGGLVVGQIFWQLRQVGNRWLRTGTVLIAAGATAAFILYTLENYSSYLTDDKRILLGVQVLLAIPLLYLLTLAGRAEETELEIGSMCVALGVGLWLLLIGNARLTAVVVPPVIYLLYTQQILRRLLVFKHVLRGMSYCDLGQHRQALLAYRRALQLDPRNALAREGHWRVHKEMDFSKVINDPETMALVDLNLCLDRATELVLRSKPKPEELEEAHKLLNLVLDQRPIMQPAVYYWRAVAHTHSKEFDKAEAELRAVLDSSNYAPDDAYRQSVLLAAWLLALVQHSELRRRVGTPLITTEGRRLEAIAAVEKQLLETADDAGAWQLKRLLYENVTEEEYRVRAGAGSNRLPDHQFDHEYVLQLGLALIGDSARWQRGAEFLRLAAQGLVGKGPTIYHQIAQACERAGDAEGARYNYEMIKLLAREIGIKNLDEEEKKAYFSTVKQLGEAAYSRGDFDKAIENLTLYSESNQSGLDTVRLLTELYERKGDALGALKINERALFYDGKDKLLLERKDRYYYSVTPAELQSRMDMVKNSFDVAYCLNKAKSLLELKNAGPEQEDWAVHLAGLARVFKPDNIQAHVLAARVHLRRNEVSEALTLFEEARSLKPEKFPSADESDAWYLANRHLGDLYLVTFGKPEQALQCLADYRKCTKSGADTLYKMGQAYEQLGDAVKAAKCYKNVTIYDHPLASDAQMALRRLETSKS